MFWRDLLKSMTLLFIIPASPLLPTKHRYFERLGLHVESWVDDIKNPDYGLPDVYRIEVVFPDGSSLNCNVARRDLPHVNRQIRNSVLEMDREIVKGLL